MRRAVPVLAIAATILMVACEIDVPSGFVEFTVNARSNGNPIPGVEIRVDGEPIGTTGADGSLTVEWDQEGQFTVSAHKTFFAPLEAKVVNVSEATAAIGVDLEMAPHIFVPDFGTGRIVRLPTVEAPAADYLEITAVDHAGGSYGLQGPIGLYTDYDAGVIYILDAASVSNYTTLIRLTAFPPATDGSEAQVAYLSNQSGEVRGAQQVVVGQDGSIVLIDFRATCCDPDYYSSRLIGIPASLDFADATYGPWFEYTYLYGLTPLSGGYLVTGGSVWTVEAFTVDGVADATGSAFGSLTAGTGVNQLRVTTRPVASPTAMASCSRG